MRASVSRGKTGNAILQWQRHTDKHTTAPMPGGGVTPRRKICPQPINQQPECMLTNRSKKQTKKQTFYCPAFRSNHDVTP